MNRFNFLIIAFPPSINSGIFTVKIMNSNIFLISASLLALAANAQTKKYIIGSSYSISGCDGKSDQSVNIETGKCYYAKEACIDNPNLKPGCDFLSMQSLGTDLSFVATCSNGNISVVGFNGKSCNNPSAAIQNGTTLDIPVDTCILNFKLKCSDEKSTTKTSAAPTATYSVSAGFTAIPGMAMGLLGILFV